MKMQRLLAQGGKEKENKEWEEKLKKLERDLVENPKKELIKIASESYKMLSEGHLPVGKSIDFSSDPIKINVRKGEAIQISIAPNANHGADTTLIDLKIKHQTDSGNLEWSTQDLIDILTKSNTSCNRLFINLSPFQSVAFITNNRFSDMVLSCNNWKS